MKSVVVPAAKSNPTTTPPPLFTPVCPDRSARKADPWTQAVEEKPNANQMARILFILHKALVVWSDMEENFGPDGPSFQLPPTRLHHSPIRLCGLRTALTNLNGETVVRCGCADMSRRQSSHLAIFPILKGKGNRNNVHVCVDTGQGSTPCVVDVWEKRE
jgi:hypothetical protein